MTIQDKQISQQTEPDGCLPALLRLFWLLIGNLAMLLFAVFIAMRKAPVILDAAYALLVFALIAVRYIDITRFKGQTSEGEPATLGHWRLYSIRLILAAAWIYAAAKAIAHFNLL